LVEDPQVASARMVQKKPLPSYFFLGGALFLFLFYLAFWSMVWHLVLLPHARADKHQLRVDSYAPYRVDDTLLFLDKPDTSLTAYAVWQVPKAGFYYIKLTCDDNGKVSIDNRPIITLTGISVLNVGEVNQWLSAGPHFLELRLNNILNQGWLRIEVAEPGQAGYENLKKEQLSWLELGNIETWLDVVSCVRFFCLLGFLGLMLKGTAVFFRLRTTAPGFLPKKVPKLSSKPKRIYWVDNLKAFGILLVMAGHMESINPSLLRDYIYSFHVPLFFFISGFLFQPEKYQSPREFITRKLSTLILPYFFFSFLAYGLLIFVENFLSGIPLTLSKLFDDLFGLVHANGYDLNFSFNQPLWFLPCLFLVEIEFYFIAFLKRRIQPAVIIVLFVLGIVLGQRFEHLPWTLAGSLTALLFYYLGFFLKKEISSLDDHFKPLIIISEVIISLAFCYLNGGGITFAFDYYGEDNLFFFLSAQAGIIYLTILTTYTRANKILSYLGANTLIIFGLNQPLNIIFSRLIAYYNLQVLYPLIPLTSFGLFDSIIPILNQTSIMLFLSLIQLIIISLLIPIFNKKLYFVLGREKPK